MNDITLGKQQLRKVGTVLTRYASYQSNSPAFTQIFCFLLQITNALFAYSHAYARKLIDLSSAME